MTAGRTYLSIGDVLTLLRQEFPDVTISKIRFLESQGLVNPERTPSGYRKFYEHDVERLRWVLRQQREHFLPLKVIKGRLEDETSVHDDALGADALSDDSGGNLGNGRGVAERGQKATTAVGSAQRDAERGSRTGGRSNAVGVEHRESSSDRVLEVPGHLPGFDPPAGGDSLERHLAGEGAGQHVSRSVHPPAQGATARASQHSRSSQSAASRPLGGATTGVASRPTAPGRAEGESPFGGGLKSAPDTSQPSVRAPRPGAHEAGVTDGAPFERGRAVSRPGMLTVSEIAAAAGSSESTVEELESYGILIGRNVGGSVHFDESEVAIARVAGEFAKFGIEPRHLRLYKHASEREAGFVEQLVLPLLKQRNPEARKRAEEMLTDLTRLGEGLKAAMVRRSLRDLLGG